MSAHESARWSLILNGEAIEKLGQDLVDDAIARLGQRGVRLELHVTGKPGDARRYVDQAVADQVDCVIAGGGDGTLGAVASALASSHLVADALPALGLVPLGTANDFADAAGIPDQFDMALDLLYRQSPHPVDLLRIKANGQEQWCANMATGGFGATATAEASDALKRTLGGLAYLTTGIAEMTRSDPEPLRLHGPGLDWKGDFIALGLGNARQAGGGQRLCAQALINDGLIDVTVVPELSGELAETLARVATQGKQAALDAVAVKVQLPWVEVESPQAIVLNLDGEPLESSRFLVECVPGRLRMHLPRDCPLLADAATVAT